jgi:hypothetical protein
VAEKVLNQIFPKRNILKNYSDMIINSSNEGVTQRGVLNLFDYSATRIDEWKETILSLIKDESVQHFEDLIFRRSNIWERPEIAENISNYWSDIIKEGDLRKPGGAKKLSTSIGCRIN